jgi:hypothetical protein
LEISLLYKYTLKRLNAQGGQHGAR